MVLSRIKIIIMRLVNVKNRSYRVVRSSMIMQEQVSFFYVHTDIRICIDEDKGMKVAESDFSSASR